MYNKAINKAKTIKTQIEEILVTGEKVSK